MTQERIFVTLASLSYTDGTHSIYAVGRGRLRGPKGKRYFDWNAKDTVEVARVHVCTYRRLHLNNTVHEQLQAQYATPEAPPIDWNL